MESLQATMRSMAVTLKKDTDVEVPELDMQVELMQPDAAKIGWLYRAQKDLKPIRVDDIVANIRSIGTKLVKVDEETEIAVFVNLRITLPSGANVMRAFGAMDDSRVLALSQAQGELVPSLP